MFLIGVSEDLIHRDGRPRHPAVDLERRLGQGDAEVRVQALEIPPDRFIADDCGDRFDVLVLADCSIRKAAIVAARCTRLICRFGKGYDDIDVAAATARGIVVTRVVNAGEDAMASGTMALILALTTRLLERREIGHQPNSNWDFPLNHGAIGLKDKILGIVGFGRVGRAVARRGRAGLTVIWHDPHQYPAACLDAQSVELAQLMSRSDIVSVNCPLTPQTRGLISPAMIGRMKPVAYLVNTGRGAVVDEDGLAAALIAGRIDGAALDVFAAEPLPADSPLRQAPNLIMTPHAIGVSDEMYAEYMEQVADAIEQFSSGRCPNDAVNPEGFGRA
jgi:phosphoglycerate dehydrogenase-like enzyme